MSIPDEVAKRSQRSHGQRFLLNNVLSLPINALGVSHPTSGAAITNSKKILSHPIMAGSRKTEIEPEYDALLADQEQEESDFYSARNALLKPRQWWRTRAGTVGAIILTISLSINGLLGYQHFTGGGISHDGHEMMGHSKFGELQNGDRNTTRIMGFIFRAKQT